MTEHDLIGFTVAFIQSSKPYERKSEDLLNLPFKHVELLIACQSPICKFGKAHFHKAFRGYGIAYGKCSSKKESYLGYKLLLLTTLDGFITDFVMSAANIDDRVAIWDLVAPYREILVLGDKGYISENLATQLKTEKGILLLSVPKNNRQYPKAIRQLIFKLR